MKNNLLNYLKNIMYVCEDRILVKGSCIDNYEAYENSNWKYGICKHLKSGKCSSNLCKFKMRKSIFIKQNNELYEK